MSALETLARLAPAYAATVGIGAACAYVGLFAVLRRIVFTGVALAQLAAAGVAAAFFVAEAAWLPAWLTAAAQRHGATVGSLGLTLAGALLLDARAGRQVRVPPDALVGLAYAASSAAAVLLVWRSPHGLAELQNILAGEVLLSREGQLATLWVGLAAVALVHARWRRELLLVSFDPEFARTLGLPERRLQLLLLGSLAVTVAVSLEVGGLLLVFALLVVPPSAGLLLGRGLGESTLLAVAVAVGAALVGFLLAIRLDLPVAPSVAAAAVALFAAAWLGHRAPRVGACVRATTLALAAAGLGAVPVAFALRASAPPVGAPAVAPVDVEPAPARDDHAHGGVDDLHGALRALASAETPAARREAAARLAREGDVAAIDPLVAALEDEEPDVREAALAAIEGVVAHDPAGRARLEALLADPHAERRVLAATALWRLGDVRAVGAYVAALADEDVPLLLKDRVLHRLEELTGDGFGYDPFASAEENRAAVERWRAWWRAAEARLRWDPARGTFDAP